MTDTIEDRARELVGAGCGCDTFNLDDVKICPNWNGERCTYAEFRIAAALRAEGNRALEEARETVAAWMIANGYATGHGDTLEDLLAQLPPCP